MSKIILRLSQRLARKVNSQQLDAAKLHENPCADWSGRLFVAGRTEYILVSNTTSMYSCVFPIAGIENSDLLLTRFLNTMETFMLADDQDAGHRQLVAAAAPGVTFAQPLDRFIAVSMSDHVHSTKLYLADGMKPDEIGLRLNSTRIALRTHSRRRYFVRPRDVHRELTIDGPQV